MTAIEHGVLSSHASQAVATDLVDGGFASAAAARAHGSLICAAQPGIEFEPMARTDRSSPWRSADGRTVSEVIAARWSA